jgi:hypothetical protein
MTIDILSYHSPLRVKDNGSLPQSVCCNTPSSTDWAILNSTDAKRLRRLLQATDDLTMQRIEQACRLIEAYHAVYRRDLMRLRRRECFSRCPPPTLDQLQQIAASLNQEGNQDCSTTDVLSQLQALAQQLRAVRADS